VNGLKLLGPLEILIHQTLPSEVGQNLDKFGVVHILLNTSQTPTVGFIDCLTASSISWAVKSSWELQGTTMQWKITMFSLSISSNISSFLEVEMKLSLLEEKALLSHEENIFDLK